MLTQAGARPEGADDEEDDEQMAETVELMVEKAAGVAKTEDRATSVEKPAGPIYIFPFKNSSARPKLCTKNMA